MVGASDPYLDRPIPDPIHKIPDPIHKFPDPTHKISYPIHKKPLKKDDFRSD